MNIKGIVTGVVMLIIGFVLVFYLVGGLAPTLTTAAGNISGSGLPLASLFASNGVVMIIFMCGILITLVVAAFAIFKQK